MKEKPILFQGEMVCAVLEGGKTQTRRIIKNKLPYFCAINGIGDAVFTDNYETQFERKKCPYGNTPGDELWVRETWGMSGHKRVEYKASPADGSDFRCVSRWKPSIHMPRWASRIQLRIEEIRVERVQDISEEDAEAEGVFWDLLDDMDPPFTASDAFAILWDNINGKREGCSWDDNPYVWVIKFKRIRP